MTPSGIDCEALVAYLDEYLQAGRGRDFGPNGLQVEGHRRIARLVTGVSACLPLFERAAEWGADAVLVHHGLLWDNEPRTLTGVQYGRIAALVRHGLHLLAYHLPLDRHPEVGNNAVAAALLGLTDVEPFAPFDGLPLGMAGRFPAPISAGELLGRCAEVFEQAPLAFTYGPDPLSSLGIVSGGAQRELHAAIRQGLDAYLTGEASEWVMNVAREAGIHYLACGHYATERLGVRALGEHLADRFGIEVAFIDVPNPV